MLRRGRGPPSVRARRKRTMAGSSGSCADAAERAELRMVGWRRGGEQDDPAGAECNSVNGRPAIGGNARHMSFVHDQQIPSNVLEWPQCFGPFHEVERSDVDARCRPRVDLRRQASAHRAQPIGVRQRGLNGEVANQLIAPLLSQSRRREDQRPEVAVTARQFAQNQAGLDGLSKPHVVCDQQSRMAVAEHGERRLELVRQHVECRRPVEQPSVRLGRHEDAGKRVRPRSRGEHHKAPSWNSPWPIERQQKRPRPRSEDVVETQRLAISERRPVGNRPLAAAKNQPITMLPTRCGFV